MELTSPHLDPILQNCKKPLHPCRGADPVSTHAEGTVDSDQMLGLDLWKKTHFWATKTWNSTTMNYTKLVEKPRIFIQRFGTSSWRCLPSYDRRQGIFLSWGMTVSMGFANFHPPLLPLPPEAVTGGRWILGKPFCEVMGWWSGWSVP